MKPNTPGRIRVFLLAGVVATSVACANRETTAPELAASVTISSGGQTVFEVLQTLQLTAIVRDTGGAPLTGQAVTWTASDTTIASVSRSGVVSGKRPGDVVITAACAGSRAELSLTVAPPVVAVSASAEVSQYVASGGTMFVYATATDASGNTISGLPITWSSADNSVATVAPFSPANAGVVTAVAAGTVSITATIGGASGTTSVTVVPLSAVASIRLKPATVTFVAGPTGFGSTAQMSLTAADASGNAVVGVPVTWSISNDSAATLSSAGLLTPNPAVYYGSMETATVTASVAALSASIPVVVCPEVATIAVSMPAVSIAVGQSVVLAATALDAHGRLELAPLESQTVYPNGINLSVQRAGFDSLLIKGLVPGTASLTFRDAVSGVQSQAIPISVASSSLIH